MKKLLFQLLINAKHAMGREVQIKKNQLTNAGIDDSKFVFEDKSLYKIYLQLCQKRDAITPVSPDRIEYLKKGIFSLVQ